MKTVKPMKNYIYNRYIEGKRTIKESLHLAKLHYTKDSLVKARDSLNKVINIKTFPKSYREKLHAILEFCWEREIFDKLIRPRIFEDKLYCFKWEDLDKLPKGLKGLKEEIMLGKGHKFTSMLPEDYTFGMDMDYDRYIVLEIMGTFGEDVKEVK